MDSAPLACVPSEELEYKQRGDYKIDGVGFGIVMEGVGREARKSQKLALNFEVYANISAWCEFALVLVCHSNIDYMPLTKCQNEAQ